MADRTVHGFTDGGAPIVRYERAGKWYVEYGGVRKPWRDSVTVDEAARCAAAGQALPGLKGGGRFDLLVKRNKERSND